MMDFNSVGNAPTSGSGYAQGPDTIHNGKDKAELKKLEQKLNEELSISDAKKSFAELIGMMAKGSIDLSNQVDQKLQG